MACAVDWSKCSPRKMGWNAIHGILLLMYSWRWCSRVYYILVCILAASWKRTSVRFSCRSAAAGNVSHVYYGSRVGVRRYPSKDFSGLALTNHLAHAIRRLKVKGQMSRGRKQPLHLSGYTFSKSIYAFIIISYLWIKSGTAFYQMSMACLRSRSGQEDV